MTKCLRFKSYTKGHLQGFADIQDGIWTIYGCKLFMKNGYRWIALPQEERIDDQGNKSYSSKYYIQDKDEREAFSQRAIKAIEEYCASAQQTETTKQELPF